MTETTEGPNQGRMSKWRLQPPEVALQNLTSLPSLRKAAKEPSPQVQILARARTQPLELRLRTHNGSH